MQRGVGKKLVNKIYKIIILDKTKFYFLFWYAKICNQHQIILKFFHMSRTILPVHYFTTLEIFDNFVLKLNFYFMIIFLKLNYFVFSKFYTFLKF